MLIDDAHRYVALRRALGFKLEKTARHLDAFTRHAVANGDSHIRTATALAWTAAGLIDAGHAAIDGFRK